MSEHDGPDSTVRVPRMPDTPERRNLERLRTVRELVFGAQDGLLTTLGIVTGVGGATTDRATILLTGLISLFVGALSMGVGQFLGGKAEREVVEHWVDYEQREMVEKPEEEFAEQLGYYRLKGFTREEARMIVDRLAKNPQIWLHEMVRDEFGIDPRAAQASGLGGVFAIAGSFALGAILPILPYFFGFAHSFALGLSLVLAVVALFTVGAVAGRLAHRNIVLKGLEIVLYGSAVFTLSYLAGRFIPPLFGHHEVNLG